MVGARARFKAAADSGHADAMVSAGAMHLRGEGGPVDGAAALSFYTRAAEEASHLGAWENLAALHATGSTDGAVKPNLLVARYIKGTIIPALMQHADVVQEDASGLVDPEENTETRTSKSGATELEATVSEPVKPESTTRSRNPRSAVELSSLQQDQHGPDRTRRAADDDIGVIDLRHV